MPTMRIPYGVLDGRYVNAAGDSMSGGLTLTNSGLHLLDTDASHDLIISPGSNLSADRTLTMVTGDSSRTVTINGSPTLDDWFNQSVKTSSSPAFAGLTLSGMSSAGFVKNNASGVLSGGNTIDISSDTNLTVTNPVTLTGDVIGLSYDSNDFQLSGSALQIKDSGIDHGSVSGLTDDDHSQYVLANGTRALTANWDTGDFEVRAQTLQADVATGTAPLVVASTTKVTNLNADKVDGYDMNQAVLTTSSPAFAGLTLSGMSSAGFVKNNASGVLSGGNTIDISSDTNLTVTNPVTLTGDVIGLSYDSNDFQLSGSALQIKDSGIDHGSVSGLTDDDHSQYILANGTRALTANWDTGDFEVRAQTLQADVATGTAPLVVASTTKVTNLNADRVDGYDMDQAVLTTSSPQFVRLGLGEAADANDILSITSISTVVGNKALDIAHTGAVSGTGYGLYVSKTGASTTNIGGYFSASGATSNYGLIVGNGSVGIGTTGPDRKLDVLDSTNPQLRLTHTDGAVYTDLQTNSSGYLYINPSGGRVGIGTNTPANALEVRRDGVNSIGVGSSTALYGSITWQSSPAAVVFYGLTDYGMALGSHGNANRLFINTAGQVGIGTTSHSAKLAINGGVHVGGDSDPGNDNLQIDGTLDHDGASIGFFGVTPAVRAAAYTISNVTTDRSYDANATNIDELADVLGTLISDLKTYGLLQ